MARGAYCANTALKNQENRFKKIVFKLLDCRDNVPPHSSYIQKLTNSSWSKKEARGSHAPPPEEGKSKLLSEGTKIIDYCLFTPTVEIFTNIIKVLKILLSFIIFESFITKSCQLFKNNWIDVSLKMHLFIEILSTNIWIHFQRSESC